MSAHSLVMAYVGRCCYCFELGDLENIWFVLWTCDSICNRTRAVTTSSLAAAILLDFRYKVMLVGYKIAAVQTDVI